MSLGEIADDSATELLGLASEFGQRVESEVALLANVVKAARRAAAASHPPVDVREVLADLDARFAETVTLRREIIGQIDNAIAAEEGPWEQPWTPPLVQTRQPTAAPTVSASPPPIFGRLNPVQMARVLTVVGTVLILVGLFLGLR